MTSRVTAEDLAALFGVETRTVTRWIASGLPVERRGRKALADPAAAVAWVRARDAEAAEARLAAALARIDPLASKGRKIAAEADLAELRLARERAEVVAVEEVEAQGRAYTTAWKTKVLALPRQAVVTGAITAEAEPKLRKIVEGLLREIAAWKVGATK